MAPQRVRSKKFNSNEATEMIKEPKGLEKACPPNSYHLTSIGLQSLPGVDWAFFGFSLVLEGGLEWDCNVYPLSSGSACSIRR